MPEGARAIMSSRSSLAHAPLIAVAGLSARMLAQSAVRAGLRVVALDVFGDRDTRAAAELWFDIGGDGLCIDSARLVQALERIARLPRLLGWISSSGLEPLIAPLCHTRGLPGLIGNRAEATAAVRDPLRFFPLLDELRIPHPEVALAHPAAPHEWLLKRADGCGGTHIEPASGFSDLHTPGAGYFQRVSPGRSLSALFVAARGSAHVFGFAEQTAQRMGHLPFVHTGSLGPIDLPPHVSARVQDAIEALCARTGLVGINSCDFLLDGDAFQILEINARPSSTLTLYETAAPQAWPRGLLACHLEACRHGRLPLPAHPPPHGAPADHAWRAGQQVLFAPRPFGVSQAFSDACLQDPHCRDVPMPGTWIEAGQPVCTLLARATSMDAVRRALQRQEARVLQRIETCHEPDYAFIQCHS